ncbi:MAG: FlgD immunoglobulin-like domain containing protein [Syntrophothermus sp.]
MKHYYLLLIILLVPAQGFIYSQNITPALLSVPPDAPCGESKSIYSRQNGINTNDNYNYIDINQIMMYVSNNGNGSHDPKTYNGGLYWPGGYKATQTAVFEDGLIWGGIINGDTCVNGNTHRQGLQAGKILSDGKADDPGLPKYRVYKIRRDWETLPAGAERDQLQKDYNEWPVSDGAPWVDVNKDGIYTAGVDRPHFIGDEVLWYVANDMDSVRTLRTYGKKPIGLEEQCTVYGFNKSDSLGNMVFKKYKIINKGKNTIKDMYLAWWSDTDLGYAADDYAGCDTLLSMGYCYNGSSSDKTYGNPAPAVGYALLQGPKVTGTASDSALFSLKWVKGYKNLPMTSFVFYACGNTYYCEPSSGTPIGSIQYYRNFQGLMSLDGKPYIDPITKLATKFVLSGDPVSGKGWYEGRGWPQGLLSGDRGLLMTSGSFNMAPGDTQEVTIAVMLGRGSSTVNSVSVIKSMAAYAQSFFRSPAAITNVDHEILPPCGYSLEQNYPNPFNPSTTIEYEIPAGGSVTLVIYDAAGRMVKTLNEEYSSAGRYNAAWDGTDNEGKKLSSGIYIYQLKTKKYISAKKMIMLK